MCDRKNQTESLKLLTHYFSQNENAKFYYAGGIVDNAYKEEIDRYVKYLKIEKNVKYLGNIMPGEELNKIYNLAKASIFPTKTEAFSLVILESLAAGLPLIMPLSQKYMVNEKLQDVILFYEDDKSFNKILEEKILNEDERRKISIASRKIIQNNFDWVIIAQNYIKEFMQEQ